MIVMTRKKNSRQTVMSDELIVVEVNSNYSDYYNNDIDRRNEDACLGQALTMVQLVNVCYVRISIMEQSKK